MTHDSFVPSLAIALLHYPMLDRQKNVVATNITNFDIHDIARACRVYGVERYYLIHPVREQLMFVARVLDHWRVGEGSRYNSSRKCSLEPVRTAENIEQALQDWLGPSHASSALRIATHARPVNGVTPYSVKDLRHVLWEKKQPVFLVFGTGYGMPDEFMQGFDGVLESIRGAPPEDFRHLSVRSAVSIYLDRLMGPW